MPAPGSTMPNQSNQTLSVGLVQRAEKGLSGAVSAPEAKSETLS